MSEHVPRPTEPQFPDTPEGQRRRRELTAWVKQNRKQLDLERERDELREKIRALQTEHIAVLAERSTANLTLVVTELQREVSSLKRQLDQVQRKVDSAARSATAARPAVENSKPRMPHKARWRTYRGFRQDMQHREEVEIEAQRGLEYKSEIDIEALSGQSGSDSAKTVKRIMKHYHLDPDQDWPPSTWPEDEPVQQLRFGGHGMAAVLAASFLFGMADAVLDHRLDGIVHLVTLLGCHFAQAV
jgi:hypothetical protein